MHNRLSTSSSKKGSIAALLRTPFLLSVMLVLIAYPLFRAPLMRIHRNNGYEISDDLALFLRDTELPEVIVAGSSLCGLGVHEPTLESRFRMASAKIPIATASPWEILQILKKNPEKLDKAKLLILDVHACQFNENYKDLHQHGNSLRELRNPFPRVPIVKVLKELSRSWDYQRMDARWKLYEKNPTLQVAWQMESLTAADHFLRDYDFSEFMDRTLRELIGFCRDRNIGLVLHVLPSRSEYINYVYENYAESHRLFLDYIRTVAEEYRCGLLVKETFPREVGSDEELFMDYGHMREQTAVLYTQWLADQILSDAQLSRYLKYPDSRSAHKLNHDSR